MCADPAGDHPFGGHEGLSTATLWSCPSRPTTGSPTHRSRRRLPVARASTRRVEGRGRSRPGGGSSSSRRSGGSGSWRGRLASGAVVRARAGWSSPPSVSSSPSRCSRSGGTGRGVVTRRASPRGDATDRTRPWRQNHTATRVVASSDTGPGRTISRSHGLTSEPIRSCLHPAVVRRRLERAPDHGPSACCRAHPLATPAAPTAHVRRVRGLGPVLGLLGHRCRRARPRPVRVLCRCALLRLLPPPPQKRRRPAVTRSPGV